MTSNWPTENGRRRSRDIERCAADWLARRDNDAWSETDEAAFQAWLAADTRHKVAFLRLHAAWQHSGRLNALAAGLPGGDVPPRGRWGQAHRDTTIATPGTGLETLVFSRSHTTKVPRPKRWGALLASGVLVVAAAILGTAYWHNHAKVDVATHDTGLGNVLTVALTDGTHATLGSDTHIEVELSPNKRRIALRQGEVYFDTVSDPRRPFIVDAGRNRVVSIGTRFSVRRDHADLRVVVTEGRVRLESSPQQDAPSTATVLPAGSVAIIDADGVLVRSLPLAEAEQLTDWRSGMLVFKDTPLAEAVREFNRYNARKIVIADADLGRLRIGGSFRWNNAEGFVRLVEQGFPIRADYQQQAMVLHAP